MGFTINVMLARDLYPESLPGDEPEPPEVVSWPLARLDELLAAPEFTEARAIAALSVARSLLVDGPQMNPNLSETEQPYVR